MYSPLSRIVLILSLFVSLQLSVTASATPKPEKAIEIEHSYYPLKACSKKPNCVNSIYSLDKKHYVQPLVLEGMTIDEQKSRLLEVLNTFDRVSIVDIQSHYIKAEFKSRIFGFVDDVEFYIKESHIDVRSASRVGYGDMGVNRRRIEAIRGKLQP